MADKKNRQNRKPRQARRPARNTAPTDPIIYGLHAARAALENPERTLKAAMATKNAASRFETLLASRGLEAEIKSPQEISQLTGDEAVHQGIALKVEALEGYDLHDLEGKRLVVVLDQITDPHNVGAIMRTAVALGADALLTTSRHSARETGLLAKTASGGLDLLPLIQVPNLAQALVKLGDFGFYRIGLDSEGSEDMAVSMAGNKLALVLGAEGSGLRRLTRERCDVLARLDMPGAIKSLNVSNAATLSLYLATKHLKIT